MQNEFDRHMLTDAGPFPKHQSAPIPGNFPHFIYWPITAYGISLWTVWATCPNYAPPSQLFGVVVLVLPHWQSAGHKKTP